MELFNTQRVFYFVKNTNLANIIPINNFIWPFKLQYFQSIFTLPVV
jgi:hypothetical protein